MTDMELVEEIERIKKTAMEAALKPMALAMEFHPIPELGMEAANKVQEIYRKAFDQIIAALRREPEREGFYEKLWKDFVSLQRGDAQGIIAKVEAYYRERPPSGDLDEPYFYLRGYRKRWRSFSHLNGNVISYDDIVGWSGIDSDREVIRERIYTITYAMPHGSKRRDGTLVQGESVEFESGMVFNISRTEKA